MNIKKNDSGNEIGLVGNYKSRCVSWKNHTVRTLYSSMEPNLTDSDVKEHYYTFSTPRDSSHKCRNSFHQ